MRRVRSTIVTVENQRVSHNLCVYLFFFFGLPRQTEVAQVVPGRLRPRIFRRFGTTRVVGRQPNAPTAFTPGEIPGTHFQRLSRPQGTWFCRGNNGKKPPVTPPGIDPGTVRLIAQCLNLYATPGVHRVQTSIFMGPHLQSLIDCTPVPVAARSKA